MLLPPSWASQEEVPHRFNKTSPSFTRFSPSQPKQCSPYNMCELGGCFRRYTAWQSQLRAAHTHPHLSTHDASTGSWGCHLVATSQRSRRADGDHDSANSKLFKSVFWGCCFCSVITNSWGRVWGTWSKSKSFSVEWFLLRFLGMSVSSLETILVMESIQREDSSRVSPAHLQSVWSRLGGFPDYKCGYRSAPHMEIYVWKSATTNLQSLQSGINMFDNAACFLTAVTLLTCSLWVHLYESDFTPGRHKS